MTLLAQIWAVAIVAYLPGALVFRLPLADLFE